MFKEPEDYRPKTPPPTSTTYTCLDGTELTFQLLGHSPLWGHILWNAGRTLASYLEAHPELVRGKTVLELGAGAGTPGVVAGILGAKVSCVTDFPDPDLVQNIAVNVENLVPKGVGFAEGYAWGKESDALTRHLPPEAEGKFDVVLMADLLFNHKEHNSMVRSLKHLLRPGSGRGYVFFTPHRTWLYEKDMGIFDRVRRAGGWVEKVGEWKMTEMFIEDKGDPELRGTVFGYVVGWPDGWVDDGTGKGEEPPEEPYKLGRLPDSEVQKANAEGEGK